MQSAFHQALAGTFPGGALGGPLCASPGPPDERGGQEVGGPDPERNPPPAGFLSGELGLDVERFDSDRRSDAVAARVREDFRGGVRAGVVTTPTLFTGGRMYAGRIDDGVLEAL